MWIEHFKETKNVSVQRPKGRNVNELQDGGKKRVVFRQGIFFPAIYAHTCRLYVALGRDKTSLNRLEWHRWTCTWKSAQKMIGPFIRVPFCLFFWCQDTQTFLCGGRHKMVTWSADAHEEDSDDDDADDGSRAVGGWRWLHHDPMTYNRQKRPVPPPSPLPAVPSLPRGHWETSKYR